MSSPLPIYGLMVRFLTPDELLRAARSVKAAGYRRYDAFTPYVIEGLDLELGLVHSRVPGMVLVGAVAGALVGFAMQYYSMAIDYRMNSGGRPYNSWQAFLPVTFEVLILVASLCAFLSMFTTNGLPQLHHPVFEIAEFARASQDQFFLCIEARDEQFELETTQRFLEGLKPDGDVFVIPDTAAEKD